MSEKLCVVRNSPIHGSGVFAVKPIKKGTRIIEYKGKRLTHKEADRIYGGTSESGNAARWINHGCAPNCTSICEEADDGKPEHERVFIDAVRDIKAGEELTYSYFITLEEPHTRRMQKIWKCLCGSKKCTGTMLEMKKDE